MNAEPKYTNRSRRKSMRATYRMLIEWKRHPAPSERLMRVRREVALNVKCLRGRLAS